MTGSALRSRTVLILPLVLLVVALLEDIVMYKARQHVHDLYWRAAIALVLTGVGFALAAGYVGPWLKRMFISARKGSKTGGKVGIWLFYAVAYGALYYAYLVVERRGAGGLLPASLR